MTLKYLSSYPFPSEGLLCYYHTGSAENALDIVRNCHLRGSVPTEVNDQNDLRIDVKNLKTCKYLRERFSLFAGQPGTFRNYRNIEKCVACHTKDCMDMAYRFVCMAEAKKVDADSKSECYFWEKYARQFVGVRFKFRLDSDFLSKPTAQEVFFDMVSYNGIIPVMECADVEKLRDFKKIIGEERFLQELMYDKSPKWSIEYEWRLGSTLSRLTRQPSKKDNTDNYFFNFNADHLLGVDIGEAANGDTTQLLLQLLKWQNIPTRIASPSTSCEKSVNYQIVV